MHTCLRVCHRWSVHVAWVNFCNDFSPLAEKIGIPYSVVTASFNFFCPIWREFVLGLGGAHLHSLSSNTTRSFAHACNLRHFCTFQVFHHAITLISTMLYCFSVNATVAQIYCMSPSLSLSLSFCSRLFQYRYLGGGFLSLSLHTASRHLDFSMSLSISLTLCLFLLLSVPS